MNRVLQRFSIMVMALALAGGSLAKTAPADPQSSSGNQKMQERITREVRHELVMIPQLSIFDNLAYRVDGNTVTLLGQVRNPVIKDEAQGAVKHIEGVEQVNNQIEVLPTSFNDDRIRRQVAHAISMSRDCSNMSYSQCRRFTSS